MGSPGHLVRLALFLLLAAPVPAAEPLQEFTKVRLVDSPANDGDSFLVKAGERSLHLRLYFVDCPESVATTDADAKRVREQARYFGITEAKQVLQAGRAAKDFTAQVLAEPFTVHTAFADALGRSAGGRVYAFVRTAEGKDLARLLVENGHARAYGYDREGPDGTSPDEIQRQLEDLESKAMLKRSGIWASTDPEALAQLRAALRAEQRDVKEVLRESRTQQPRKPIDLNTATTRDLQSISGIGPTLAAKIIAGRPYRSADDLLRVPGIGPRLLARIRPYVTANTTPAEASEPKEP